MMNRANDEDHNGKHGDHNMSKVTDIVILCSLSENVVGGGVWYLNGMLKNTMDSLADRAVDGEEPIQDISDQAGGDKHLQANIYAGAINYLNVDEFIEWAKGDIWQHPATVQLLIQQKHECGFKRIPLERVKIPADESKDSDPDRMPPVEFSQEVYDILVNAEGPPDVHNPEDDDL